MKPTTLSSLYELRTYVLRNPKANATKWHKNTNVKYATGLALRKAGIIKNYGGKRNPTWHWVGVVPSNDLLSNVLSWEKAINNKTVIEFTTEKKTEANTDNKIVLANVAEYLTFFTKAGTPIYFDNGTAIIEKNGQRLEVKDETMLVKLVNML